jgi:hypothetical protein
MAKFSSAILLEVHYLPSIAYFSALSGAERIIFERHENFVKQTFRNRCYINTEHGRHMLTIPVALPGSKVRITDVKIDYGQNWMNHQWRTIQSAYGKAPFFEHYADDLHDELFRRHVFLYDLNFNLLTLCLRWLRWNVAVEESLSYEKIPTDNIYDLRSFLTPRNTDNAARIYQPVPYYQVFGNSFADNLSFIDLIFCSGPEAGRIVQSSRRAG